MPDFAARFGPNILGLHGSLMELFLAPKGGGREVDVLSTHKIPLMTSYGAQEARTHISRFLADTRVEPVGDWRGPARVGGIRIGGFSFALIELGARMTLKVKGTSNKADHVVITSCLQGSMTMNVDGEVFKLEAGQGFYARPSHIFKGECSSDCVRLAVKIDSHLLGPDHYPHRQEFDIEQGPLRPWFELVQFLLSSPSLIEVIDRDPALAESMEGVLSRLLQSLAPRLLGTRQSSAASRDVRRAEVFIRAHAARRITLTDIAAAAEANSRTLQNNFRRYRSMTPIEYLRNVRLDKARDLLMGGEVEVVDAAFASGFAHQGRFAQHYRARFGEPPSATLKRASPAAPSPPTRGRPARPGTAVD